MTPSPFNLTQSDINRFAREGITRETLVKAGVWRVDSFEGAELVGQVTKKNAPKMNCAGIVFPYRYIGETEVREIALRLDNPPLELQSDGSAKEERKYLNPIGSKNKFYFTPTTPAERLSDLSVDVYFVEGIKKALALQAFFDRRDEPALVIALSGIWNWRGTRGKEINGNGARVDVRGIISDFDLVAWEQRGKGDEGDKGRQVNILYDAPPHKNDDVKKARKALAAKLRKLGASVRILEMPSMKETDCKGIDDLIGAKGDEFVAEWLISARQSTRAGTAKVKIAGFTFTANEKGVTAQPLDENGNALGAPLPVCSPLWIEAITRDEHAGNFGRLLYFIDPDGNEKRWAMPASLLSGDKATYESYLRDQGVDIFHSKHLHTYLASKSDKRVLVVSRTGWHKGAFIFADECIGSDDGEEIFHQSPEGGNHLMQAAGTLEEWKRNIAAYCVGNSRLILAVSTGFAATLLEKLRVESGGFQLRGGTSTGKTTALFVGGSVWGGGSDKGFLRRWRATINGIEAVAAGHNDALLCLDELAEVDPYQAGETAYMLANGQGKIRQNKNITLRKPLEWRTLFLSSGEISLADHLATVGKRARGGMEVRLVDLPADAGKGFGAWEVLHDFKSGKEFSDHLQEASKTYYGTAAREFIRRLIEQPIGELREAWRNFKAHFHKTYCPANAKEEAGRVCDRFALVAFAGEMATEAGITGWTASDFESGIVGDATEALSKLFKEWLSARGPGRSDEETAISQVRLFLEQYGTSRFQPLREKKNSKGEPIVLADGEPDVSVERISGPRAGYVEGEGEGTTWYILPEVFKAEVCKGFDAKLVAKSLQQRNWLRADHGLQTQKRTPEGKLKLYAISGIFQG